MVVIVLEKCPLSLRGSLTKWMQEVSLGVYVGRVSARVRDKLWEQVCAEVRGGRATMVFSAQNEQHLDFRVHNTSWSPVDFDGLKLMMRPSASRLKAVGDRQNHFSDAAKHRQGSRCRKSQARDEPDGYVVVDVETTGLDQEHDEIIEIGAIKVIGGDETGRFQVLVKTDIPVPPEIVSLTGIDEEAIAEGGVEAVEAVGGFLDFIGSLPLVMHNAAFDMAFLDRMLEQCDEDELQNEVIDTLGLSRKSLPNMTSHKLDDLAALYGIAREDSHRALSDAACTRDVFLKLIKN